MILTAPLRPEWRNLIPSVVHEDQSSRIQTVTPAASPGYHQLLSEFKKITGISVLLNTSFNRKGMPIVETPEQAIQFFLSCELDVLVLGNHIVFKLPRESRNLINPTDLFIENLRAALERNSAMARTLGGAYQINIAGARSFMIDLSESKPALVEGVLPAKPLAAIE